ncbi:hypothetical protein MMC18_009508 [Xylographa bjoerkii]|nr:hypothetical protein [Xylographa bjoerkii]
MSPPAPLPGWLLLHSPSSTLTLGGLPPSSGLEPPSPHAISTSLCILETPTHERFLRLSAHFTTPTPLPYKGPPLPPPRPWYRRLSFRRARKQTSRHETTFDFPLRSAAIRPLTIFEAAQRIPLRALHHDCVLADGIREGGMGALEVRYAEVRPTGLLEALEVAGEEQRGELLELRELLRGEEFVFLARVGEEFWGVGREGEGVRRGMVREKEEGWRLVGWMLRGDRVWKTVE